MTRNETKSDQGNTPYAHANNCETSRRKTIRRIEEALKPCCYLLLVTVIIVRELTN